MLIRFLSNKVHDRKLKLALAYLILFFTSMTSQALTITVDEEHPFGLSIDDENPIQAVDQMIQTEFLFEIPPSYYIYKDSLRVVLDDERVKATLLFPAAETKNDIFRGQDTEIYHHQIVLPVQFEIPDNLLLNEVSGKIYYQGCSDKICYRLMNQDFHFKIQPISSLVEKKSSDAAAPSGLLAVLTRTQDFETVLEHGLPFALFIAFLAGVLTTLTPCVLPVIPLTLTFMGVRKNTHTRTKIISLLFFVAGLVLMYSSLGVLSALLGKTLGFWFQSRSFQMALVFFFLMMGLWMLGVIQLNIPSSLQNKITHVHPHGHARQLYAGLTIGFLAAPCVGPIVGPMLIFLSLSKNVLLGFILMASYSLGLSTLFFALGFFSRHWLHHFGKKSDMIKKLLGVLLIATAAFYAYVLFKPVTASAKKNMPLFEVSSYAAATKQALQQNKGVLVDFYADWCLPCQEWEKNVWQNPAAQKAIRANFVPVQIDCTENTPECEETTKRFNIIGWPTVVFINPDLKEEKSKRLTGQIMTAEEFIMHINKVKSAHP